MDKRTLRNSDIQVSAMGVGAWAIGGEWMFDGRQAGWGKVDDAESIRAIQVALDAGINLIDTAANYGTGHSEQIVGRAISGRRDKVVIATKFGFDVDEAAKRVVYQSPEAIIRNLAFECERSLRNLGTDVIDIYQLHMWTLPSELVPELIEELEELVTAGKIRTYGWSTDSVEMAQLIAPGNHCSIIQHSANVLEPANAMFGLTNRMGLISLVRSPLLMGFLSDKYQQGTRFGSTDCRSNDFDAQRINDIVANRDRIREILVSDGRTVVQGALGWLWALGDQVVPIPGIRTEAQAIENAAAMQFGPLSPQQMAEIESLLAREELVTL